VKLQKKSCQKKPVKRYLLDRVTLRTFIVSTRTTVQFADALMPSAVVWFRKTPPPQDHRVNFTFGDTLFEPKLAHEPGIQVKPGT
jgi:adenine-specific DNA-methyltransferase